ncbi:hypothetical protein V8E53_014788 [Lactarius tabidus]
MPYPKKTDPGLDIDGLSARSSLDPDMLSLLANQMRRGIEQPPSFIQLLIEHSRFFGEEEQSSKSEDQTGCERPARKVGISEIQVAGGVTGSNRAGLFDQADQTFRQDPWPLDSYSSTTRGADGLLSHLGLALSPALSPTWLAICLASLIPTSIAPQELLETEEKAANQLDLEREKDSVTYLSQARDDIEEQRRIQATLD